MALRSPNFIHRMLVDFHVAKAPYLSSRMSDVFRKIFFLFLAKNTNTDFFSKVASGLDKTLPSNLTSNKENLNNLAPREVRKHGRFRKHSCFQKCWMNVDFFSDFVPGLVPTVHQMRNEFGYTKPLSIRENSDFGKLRVFWLLATIFWVFLNCGFGLSQTFSNVHTSLSVIKHLLMRVCGGWNFQSFGFRHWNHCLIAFEYGFGLGLTFVQNV